MSARRLWPLWFAAGLALGPALAAEPSASVQALSDAITELDVERARRMLPDLPADSPAVAQERARLSIYYGDCDAAAATLATLEATPDVQTLAALARSCSRAVAASVVVEDKQAGLWVRLQDDEDRVLLPFISEVVQSARQAVEQDFGVELPRPLRIDLVRDLFTLAAVSGLPVEAAETTGTVAVARWGRVTLLSPRATQHGYPWEDTLAHEITHLALSRATRDHAPLWLQEGLAKRQETRWRKQRPFDRDPAPDEVATQALLSGQAVGIDKLGPSIAMLPSPYAASIAFAEVASFMEDWVDRHGVPALHLLLADLKVLGPESADAALKSATGYDLTDSIRLWQSKLLQAPMQPTAAPDLSPGSHAGPDDPRDFARAVRVGELLFSAGRFESAQTRFHRAFEAAPTEPAIRWRLGRSQIAAGKAETAENLFTTTQDISAPHAGWYALQSRFLRENGDDEGADRAYALAIGLDPLHEDAACAGQFRIPDSDQPVPLPQKAARRALCEAARKIPRE